MKRVMTAVACGALAFTACATTGASDAPAAAPEGEKMEKSISGAAQTSNNGIPLTQGPFTLTRAEFAPAAELNAELRLYKSTEPDCPLNSDAVFAKLRQGSPYTGSLNFGTGEVLCGFQPTRDQNGTVTWWQKTPQQ